MPRASRPKSSSLPMTSRCSIAFPADRARGIAGTVLVHKVAGSTAAAGKSLAEVAAAARGAASRIGTMGVALTACTVPTVGKPGFDLGPDEIEIGLGIHGEAGFERMRLASAHDLVATLVEKILSGRDIKPGMRCALLVNGLGATPPMELSIVAREALAALREKGLSVERAWTGTLLSALDMAGCSVTVMTLDDNLIAALDAPGSAASWPPAGLFSPPDTSSQARRKRDRMCRRSPKHHRSRPLCGRTFPDQRDVAGPGSISCRSRCSRRRWRPWRQHGAWRRGHRCPRRSGMDVAERSPLDARRCPAPGDRRQLRPLLCHGAHAGGTRPGVKCRSLVSDWAAAFNDAVTAVETLGGAKPAIGRWLTPCGPQRMPSSPPRVPARICRVHGRLRQKLPKQAPRPPKPCAPSRSRRLSRRARGWRHGCRRGGSVDLDEKSSWLTRTYPQRWRSQIALNWRVQRLSDCGGLRPPQFLHQ